MRRTHQVLASVIAAVLLFAAVLPVSAAQIDNGTVYPVVTDSIPGWPKGPDTFSETAVLMEAETGTILYDKGMDVKRYPASITKLMTCLLAVENCSMDEKVVFTEECLADQTPDSSNLAMQVGEELTMEQCLSAMMLVSANDIATQIAVHVAGSVADFAGMMNDRAAELGCENTNFVNSSGMPDPNQYTSARDMALIFQAGIANETFRKIIELTSYVLPATNKNPQKRPLSTHNAMRIPSTPQYDEYCFGGKTGGTAEARSTLVTGAEKDGMTLIAVALRADGGQVCLDHSNLYRYGFDQFSRIEVPGGTVVIPAGMTLDDLTVREESGADGTAETVYSLGEIPVGKGIVTPTPEPAETTEPAEAAALSDEKEQAAGEETAETGGAEPEKRTDTDDVMLPVLCALAAVNLLAGAAVVITLIARRKGRR